VPTQVRTKYVVRPLLCNLSVHGQSRRALLDPVITLLNPVIPSPTLSSSGLATLQLTHFMHKLEGRGG